MSILNSYRTRLLLICLVVVLVVAAGLSQSETTSDTEVIITITGEEHHYQPRPELGYVIKIRQEDNARIQVLTEALLPENAMPIGGLGRRGIWIVENEQSVEQAQNARMLFGNQSQVQYIAPLFSCNDETVAIIPEIVVRVKPEIQAEQVQALCEKVDCSIIKPMEFTTQEYLLQVLGPDAEAVFKAVEQLNDIDSIEWVAPNTAFQSKLLGQAMPSSPAFGEPLQNNASSEDANNPGIFPNDEYFPMQWHLHNTGQSGGTPGADIRAPEAWEITTGDPNIVVVVVDTGVDSNHPDLIDNLVPGYDFYEKDDQPDPALDNPGHAHGTACAGLISARGNNLVGVSGVTWNCGFMPIRAYIWGNYGTTPQSDIATALRWAADHGADVISNSWGDNIPLPIVHSALVDVTKPGGIGRDGKGCVVLFGSGNGSGMIRWYPPKYPEVIVVGATDDNDRRWGYSDYGPELDIAAPSGAVYNEQGQYGYFGDMWTTDIVGSPGVNNRNPAILDYTDMMAGTSAACPVAAGVAALILSIEPNLTSDEVRHFLERSAKDLGDPGRDDYYGWGRVDARAALDMVLAKRCDLNNDWRVDEQDLALLNEYIDANDLSGDIAPAARRDGKVDEMDIDLLMQYMDIEIPDIGSLARWKLDETEGVTAYDSINHRDGTLQNGPVWQPEGGILDGALQFDGTNDYFSTPYVLNPSTAGAFSVFTWVNTSTPGQVILSQTNRSNWLGTNSTDGSLMTEIRVTGGTHHQLQSQTVITDGQWHRVGLVWNGTERILYVDDVEVVRDTQSGLASWSSGLYIGAAKSLESGKFFSGLIDDVRIYDRAIMP